MQTQCAIAGGGPAGLMLGYSGDAAHAMSPVGINLAIQDAVVGANLLAEPLFQRWPVQRRMPARLVGMGFRPEHVKG